MIYEEYYSCAMLPTNPLLNESISASAGPHRQTIPNAATSIRLRKSKYKSHPKDPRIRSWVVPRMDRPS